MLNLRLLSKKCNNLSLNLGLKKLVMNILIPMVFSALTIAPADSCDICAVVPVLKGQVDVEMVAKVDSVDIDGIRIMTGDVIAVDGGSRRILYTVDQSGRVCDIIDGGSWGAEGPLDEFYLTDLRSNTLTPFFKVSDSNPVITEAPEGGIMIEFTDRIELTVINHDYGEQYDYVLRDNQVTYKVDADGMFALSSIRPKPDDLRNATRSMRVYDITLEDTSDPLDSASLARLLLKMFPLPGRVPLPIMK